MIDRKAVLKQLQELVEQVEIMEHHNETLGYEDKVKEYEAMGEKYEYLSSLVESDLEENPDNNDDAIEAPKGVSLSDLKIPFEIVVQADVVIYKGEVVKNRFPKYGAWAITVDAKPTETIAIRDGKVIYREDV